jgi:hypothetical protein
MKYIYFIIIYYSIFSSIYACQIKPKLCINCKYFVKKSLFDENKFGKCSLFPREIEMPIENDNYLVDGIKNNIVFETELYYCSTARDFDSMCGESGLRYEKNDKNS